MFLFNVLYAEGYLHNNMSLFQASRFSAMLVRLCISQSLYYWKPDWKSASRTLVTLSEHSIILNCVQLDEYSTGRLYVYLTLGGVSALPVAG